MTTAGPLISLNSCVDVTIQKCDFEYGTVGIRGITPSFSGGKLSLAAYSNVVRIRDCHFNSMSSLAIKNADDAWIVEGTTFENATYGGTAGYGHDTDGAGNGVGAIALSFIGCWMGDVTNTPSGNNVWINCCGLALTIQGCDIGGGNGLLVQHRPVFAYVNSTDAPKNSGLAVIGNLFQFLTTAITFVSGNGAMAGNVIVAGNTFTGVTTKLSGSAPLGAILQLA